MVEPSLEELFPGLRGQPYQITSPGDSNYNCIALEVGDTSKWWWPDLAEEDAWPTGVARVETVSAFQAAFATLGYVVCDHDLFEVGYEKIALFALLGIPKHASRQLQTGRWTSKLGEREDIEHALHDLTGMIYGSVALVMKRRLPGQASLLVEQERTSLPPTTLKWHRHWVADSG
jgi:hypothetical protein